MLVIFDGQVFDVLDVIINNMLALSFKLLELFIVYVEGNSRSLIFFGILQELVLDEIRTPYCISGG